MRRRQVGKFKDSRDKKFIKLLIAFCCSNDLKEFSFSCQVSSGVWNAKEKPGYERKLKYPRGKSKHLNGFTLSLCVVPFVALQKEKIC